MLKYYNSTTETYTCRKAKQNKDYETEEIDSDMLILFFIKYKSIITK